ncbi:50S ribosomal protein L24 [Candidatus Woesearchaeota archaeon]|nr:50S ribosomal protein L24 [Candidatus Woesearchaeota archaeon]
MKKKFSLKWNKSIKPNKQRKYRFNAPLHIKGKFLNAHLSRELRKKYSRRSLRLRKGDKIKVMNGRFKKEEGRIEKVELKKSRIYVDKIKITKKDGTKTSYPLKPSNVMIVELNLDDRKRIAKLKGEKKNTPLKDKKDDEKTEKHEPKKRKKPVAKKSKSRKTKKKSTKKK